MPRSPLRRLFSRAPAGRGGRASGPARRSGLAAARAFALVLGAAPAVSAHPHVFIDAGLTLETGADGTVTAVEVTWRYDAFYTLVLLQDFALDQDFDGSLTEAEVSATLGFDLQWNSGFEGGLTLRRGTAPLSLGAPAPVSLRLLDTGQLESVHRRPVTGDPGGPQPLSAQVYDPAFYIAFDAVLPSGVAGSDCVPETRRADLDAANAALDAALRAAGGAEAAEAAFPRVGALFADTLVFACAR
jgi:hypothetical protein